MKLFVANRGEIARRIIAAAQILDIHTIAIYTPEDAASPHVFEADEAIALEHTHDYQNPQRLLQLVRQTGAHALHPGYGFLSQNAQFAAQCIQTGCHWIGPPPAAMAMLGNKSQSRILAERCGIPIPPGASICQNADHARTIANTLGFPVLLKAAHGGGGRGMRCVHQPEQLKPLYDAAQREAQQLYGISDLLLEKYIHPARHIEVQVLAQEQHIYILGDRECSLQRRYQKVIEESPSSVSPTVRTRLFHAAEQLMREAGYQNAGTVEFLVDNTEQIYFLEVNPRLQVEHPVTEAVCQYDILIAQIQIALKQPVRIPPAPQGHAIEVRLNAEDPHHNFMPTGGELLAFHVPHLPFVRCDASMDTGQHLSGAYDNLLAKIIAWGDNRTLATRRLWHALRQTGLLGIQTNQSFLMQVLESAAFANFQTFTHTLETTPWPQADHALALQLAQALEQETTTQMPSPHNTPPSHPESAHPWQQLAGFSLYGAT